MIPGPERFALDLTSRPRLRPFGRALAGLHAPAVRDEDMTYEDLLQIVDLIKSASHFSEFRLKVGEIEVSLRRADGIVSHHPAAAQRNFEPAASSEPIRREPSRTFPENARLVRSPMVGTVYLSPQPGAPPFVEVGRAVEPDTTVCVIDVMKLMNSIPAGAKGVVTEILVGNAKAVEHGQVLMVIEPR